ncbi:MAG: glycoside hydrolase family 19 protein [Hyphomicrobiaceae bacterium]
MIVLTRDDLAALWRNADPAWLDAFAAHHSAWCERWDVSTPARLQHFLAQVSAETAGLRDDGKAGAPRNGLVENLGYSAKRIEEVFAYRLKLAAKRDPHFQGQTPAAIAAVLAKDRAAFAEVVYGNRPELGNTEPGDGARFIGRGPLQCTGRETYALAARELGVDCVANPALLERPEIGWQAAFAEWHASGCNALADTGSVEAVSRRVNGGTNGLAERVAWMKRIVAWWPDDADLEAARTAETTTFADIKATSRKAQVVDALGKAGKAVAVSTSTVAVASEALPTVPKPSPDAVTTALDGIGKVSEGASKLSIIGRSFRDLAALINGNGLLVLLVGAVLVAIGAYFLRRWMVEDARAGRYQPSGMAASDSPAGSRPEAAKGSAP